MNGPDIFIVTGEHSGDQLGAKLIQALREAASGATFRGVGGPRMAEQGLRSLFPLEDIAVMGIAPVIRRLPTLLSRIRETADAIIASPPDVLVIVDSPDFTHRVARRVRARLPMLPIVDYVSPSVWAWRPGRAAEMRAYVDHVLALLPFEPEAHRRLGGPPCTYVGHPLIERLGELRPAPGERRPITTEPVLLVLPGSRASVVRRHMALFGEILQRVVDSGVRPRLVLPTVESLAAEIAAAVKSWPVTPEIVTGEAAKLAAFREGNAALAASGTVTLELALSGIPMVALYKTDVLFSLIRPFVRITAPYMLLANLILGRAGVPEFPPEHATVDNVAAALLPLLSDTPSRREQEEALAELDARMKIEGKPSAFAARIVLDLAGGRGK